MKKFTNIPVYLLSLIYLVFGLNYFLRFLVMPPMQGDAGNFINLLYAGSSDGCSCNKGISSFTNCTHNC